MEITGKEATHWPETPTVEWYLAEKEVFIQ